MADLGGLIHSARVARNMTKSELAKASDVTFMYVSDLENGKRVPMRGEALSRIASVLGIDPQELRRAASLSKLRESLEGDEQKVAAGKLALARRIIKDAGPEEIAKIREILEHKGGDSKKKW